MVEKKIVKLSDLCKKDSIGIYGIPATAEEYSDEKVRYLRITDINDDGTINNSDMKSVSDDNLEKYMLQPGDIVFARTGNSTGRSYLYNEKDGKFAFAGFLIKYGLDDTKINPTYVRYFTISNYYKQWVSNLSSGSTRGNISAQTFADCPIIVPSRKQQDFLATSLSTIDQRIENLRAQNRVLVQTAKTIYDYTFLQCVGHQTTYNKTLNRNIPTNWEVKKLKDVCKVLLGGTPNTQREDYWLNGTINWLNSGEVADFPIIDCEKKITEKAVEESSTVFLPKGNVTLSITRYLRPSILAIDACINQSVAGILENGILKKSYLFPMLKTEVPKLNALRSGAQQPHINKDIVENINVVIPPKEVLDKYYSIVDPIYEKILVNSEHLKELVNQRNTLLPLLMTGQVEV